MSVQTVCLGWHWQPYRDTRTAGDVNGGRVADFPDWMAGLGRRALADAYEDPAAGDDYTPDTALINFYDDQAKLGMHQDKDEKSDAPVVSLSIGDSCVFRFGKGENRSRPYADIELASGDLFVFGGLSRLAYHGVTKVLPGTGDPPPAWLPATSTSPCASPGSRTRAARPITAKEGREPRPLWVGYRRTAPASVTQGPPGAWAAVPGNSATGRNATRWPLRPRLLTIGAEPFSPLRAGGHRDARDQG